MTSIRKTEVDVEARHSTGIPNAILSHRAIIKAKVRDASLPPLRSDVCFTDPQPHEMLMAKDLKEVISFQALLESDDHRFQTSGQYHKCLCPFHREQTPSFTVYEGGNYGTCYGCQWNGDIFKYEMEFHGCDFKTAWRRLNDFYDRYPRAGKKARAAQKKPTSGSESPALTEKQVIERKRYADRLATDGWIASEICRKRLERSGETWHPATLQKLGVEGSLGWTGDALAFIYPTGTKYRRWPEKDFFWECEGVSLWRAHRLPEADHVYLTESETDAIAMLDAGVEEKMPGVAVIAAPSATTFKDEWAIQFKGKKVTLCFDNDEAGIKGAERVAELLRPYVTKILTFNLGEVGK